MAVRWCVIALTLCLQWYFAISMDKIQSDDYNNYLVINRYSNAYDTRPIIRFKRDDTSSDKPTKPKSNSPPIKKPTTPFKIENDKIEDKETSLPKQINTTTSTTTTTLLPTTAIVAESVNISVIIPTTPNATNSVSVSTVPFLNSTSDVPPDNSTSSAEPTESTTLPILSIQNTTSIPDKTTQFPIVSTTDNVEFDDNSDIMPSVHGYDTTNTTVDHHKYYKSVKYTGERNLHHYWVDMNNSDEHLKIIKNKVLSDSHRSALTVPLNFEFPFYGHLIRSITIATGGFLYTGNLIHTWLAATQYIAPLMANFDTSVSHEATVKYADNGTSLTVQWENVSLQDDPDISKFTFQATIHKSGDIVFAYKDVPIIATRIEDNEHPVKVGLSDAYIVEKKIFYIRRKTIYEYHKIDMVNDSTIANWTAIVFKAMPTCIAMKSCDSCLNRTDRFNCQWCQHVGRCSDGLDRHRQNWMYSGCDSHNIISLDKCKGLPPPPVYIWPSPSASVQEAMAAKDNNSSLNTTTSSPPFSPFSTPSEELDHSFKVVSDGEASPLAQENQDISGEGNSVGAAVGVVFLVVMLLTITGWVTYAYFFPHSSSGQFLIRNRPSMWTWRRGEARYTAAAMHSIHM